MKKQCAEAFPKDYGQILSRGPCLLPKEHAGEHLSLFTQSGCTSWVLDQKEQSLETQFVPKEEVLSKLEEEWEGNVPQEILDLFKEGEDEQ